MTSQYFNQQSSIWDERIAEKDSDKLRDMVRRMRLNNGAAILDVGSGTGVLLPFLLNAIGQTGQVFALDFAELMLRRSRSKNPGDNTTYLLADISYIPVAPASFDVVVCYSSFPHFPDKPQALSEIRRVMRRGGRLLICHTSSRKDINRTHRRIPSVSNDLLPTEKQMRRMLAAAGFNELTIEDGSADYLVSATRSEF